MSTFQFDQDVYENVDPDNLEGRLEPGRYHLQIDTVDDSDPDYINVTYSTLAGTPAGQEGRISHERLYRSPKAIKRVVMFIIATKLATREQIKQWKQSGENKKIDLSQAEGRQICVEMEKNENGYVNWTFAGIWAVDDPAAKEIPKNDGMLATAGTGTGDPLNDVNF